MTAFKRLRGFRLNQLLTSFYNPPIKKGGRIKASFIYRGEYHMEIKKHFKLYKSEVQQKS